MFEVVFDYGEHDADAPDAGRRRRVALPRRSVLVLPRRLRGAHLPPLPARADVPPLPGRSRASAATAWCARPTSPTRDELDPADVAQPGLHLSALGHPDRLSAQQRRLSTSAACRRVEFEYTQPDRAGHGAGGRRREPGEPARSAWTAPPTSGSTWTARASPASSPSRPAPGSTSATSAPSATRAGRVRAVGARRRQAQPRPGRRAGAVHGPGRRRPARPGGAGRPDARASTSTTTTKAGSPSAPSPRASTATCATRT